jgi:hypothetical protein
VNSSEHYDRSFARYEYWDEHNPSLMLLQYVGDARQFPRKRMTLAQQQVRGRVHRACTVSWVQRQQQSDVVPDSDGDNAAAADLSNDADIHDIHGALLLPADYPPYNGGTELSQGCILYDMHHDGPHALLNHEEANDILCKLHCAP